MNIEKYRHDLEIIRLTSEQVIKDFQIHGHEIKFSGNEMAAYDELKNQIAPLLSELHQHQPSTFQSLLYRIDISEKKFRELLNESSKNNFSEKLAELVIQREFQKVLTRKFFS